MIASVSAPTERTVLEALRPIIDPDFRKSIVDLGFVKGIRIEGSHVAFKIELTTPACPVKEEFARQAREAVSALDGVDAVEVEMTANTRGSRPAQKDGVLPGVSNVIAVASGKGGVGKSTVAVNLALALRKTGATVGLLDIDVYGPSIPLMLGVHGRPEVTEERKIVPKRAHDLAVMSIGFLADEKAPVIWRGPMVHGIVQQFLSDVSWGSLDYLVLDLPPGTGDAALTLTQSAPLSGAVIVTTPQEVALIDARKGLKMFERVNVPVLGIVENMSYFVCPTCDTKHALFGEGGGERAAAELGVDLLVRIPLQPDVVVSGDEGRPTVLAHPDSAAAHAFKDLAGVVARKLAVLSTEQLTVLESAIEWSSDSAQ